MSESGDIDRNVVIAVLEANGVDVHGEEQGPKDMLVLAKGNRVEGQRLPDPVSEKMVRYLARVYGISLDKFYGFGKELKTQG
jgi:hypothetical protein